MTVRDIPRLTLAGSLKVMRMPADAALRLVPGERIGPAARLALDRVDATTRGIAATLLRDKEMQEDARRRNEAASERQRALRLRVAADRHAQQAEDVVAEGQSEAARRRRRAEEEAGRKRADARRRGQAKKKSAKAAATRQRSAAARSAAKSDQAIQERGARARLDQLDTKAQALDEKEKAQAAAEEARRLRAASSGIKARRKSR